MFYLKNILVDIQVADLFEVSSDVANLFSLTEGLKDAITDAELHLNGSQKRLFMAKTTRAFGKGGQRFVEKELNWNRNTIRKGMHELESGIVCIDNFEGRGRKPSEAYLPNLLKDITDIVTPYSQADPTFKTTQLYIPKTAKSVRELLINEKKYLSEDLPTTKTIGTKLNNLNFHQQTVKKSIPLKKIPETDAIFDEVHRINGEADSQKGVLRISIDGKAKINIGPFSRGGKNRQGENACDHDFRPDYKLALYGIFIPLLNLNYFFFNKTKETSDFIVDCLEYMMPTFIKIFNPHTIVINLDNGPENSSRRKQFIKRIVDLAFKYNINIKLAYYPPYHSKYNPIERVWGILERYWGGSILNSINKALALSSSMTYNNIHPESILINTEYCSGVTVGKKEFECYERKIKRMDGLEDWFVDIKVRPDLSKNIFVA